MQYIFIFLLIENIYLYAIYIFLLNGSKTSASVGYRPLVCFEKKMRKKLKLKSQELIINIVNIYVPM